VRLRRPLDLRFVWPLATPPGRNPKKCLASDDPGPEETAKLRFNRAQLKIQILNALPVLRFNLNILHYQLVDDLRGPDELVYRVDEQCVRKCSSKPIGYWAR
jgi:hypothetical protein